MQKTVFDFTTSLTQTQKKHIYMQKTQKYPLLVRKLINFPTISCVIFFFCTNLRVVRGGVGRFEMESIIYIYGSVFFNCVWKKNRIFSNFGDLFRKSFWAIIHLKKIFWADEGQVSRLWKWSVLCFWRKLIFFNWDFLWEENFFYISKYTYLL